MGFIDDVKAAADQIAAAPEITIISHIDADGIACEAILSQAISRQGIPVKSVFVRQLEPLTMPQVPSDPSLKVFTDLGAGQQNLLFERGLTEKDVVIIDHHVSQPVERNYTQVNCLPYGYSRMSAAGVSYFVAKQLDPENIDLAKLAIIGNVGDMMARAKCGLVGPARDIIVEDGMRHKSVEVRKKDLNCYGTATRPVHLSLAYNESLEIGGKPANPTNLIKPPRAGTNPINRRIKMKNVLALDPGYGNTKVCVNCLTASIQSAIARPQATGMATIGMKTASQVLSIELDGHSFAIGPGAWHWGNMLTSRDYSALASPERKSLAFATLAQILEPGEYDFELMVIGLPVPLLKDETQTQAVLGGLKAYKGRHHFQMEKGSYRINIPRRRCFPNILITLA